MQEFDDGLPERDFDNVGPNNLVLQTDTFLYSSSLQSFTSFFHLDGRRA